MASKSQKPGKNLLAVFGNQKATGDMNPKKKKPMMTKKDSKNC
jgi:hypothetical protein